jgi:penicillin-binding protein 2
LSSVVDRKSSSFRSRILIASIIIAVIFLVMLAHLFNLQVVNTYFYIEKANLTSRRVQVIDAPRGRIFDRHHTTPLAENSDAFTIYLNPAEFALSDYDKITTDVANAIGLTKAEIDKKIPPKDRRNYFNYELRQGVSYRTITDIAERIEEFPGVHYRNQALRFYSQGNSLSHVLGYIGKISNDEWLVLHNQGYGQDSLLGKRGIEKKYDLLLKGEDGKRFRTVDASGRILFNSEREISPVLGKDLVLTIDQKIQKLAQDALGERIGSVVVLQPATGEILAMVSYPFYDSNDFIGEESSTMFNTLRMDDRFPFLFRPIQSVYPPASTFKTIMSAAILAEGEIDPNEYVTCTGHFQLGTDTFNCHKLSGHGPVNLKSALEESCNVYFYTMGQRLGVDKISEYSTKFGFGQPTFIDVPGENNFGLVPNSAWKKRVTGIDWLGGDTVNLSIGQGDLLVSPLQLANAYAMIANGGTIYTPHVLKEIHDPNTGSIERIQPQVLHTSDIDPSVFRRVQRNLRSVVERGTANVVMMTRSTNVAGKTGTAQIGSYSEDNHSWFAAYAPYDTDDPMEQVVVVTMVEARNEWDWWAPKAADLIFHGIFNDQTYDEVLADLRPWYVVQ